MNFPFRAAARSPRLLGRLAVVGDARTPASTIRPLLPGPLSNGLAVGIEALLLLGVQNRAQACDAMPRPQVAPLPRHLGPKDPRGIGVSGPARRFQLRDERSVSATLLELRFDGSVDLTALLRRQLDALEQLPAKPCPPRFGSASSRRTVYRFLDAGTLLTRSAFGRGFLGSRWRMQGQGTECDGDREAMKLSSEPCGHGFSDLLDSRRVATYSTP